MGVQSTKSAIFKLQFQVRQSRSGQFVDGLFRNSKPFSDFGVAEPMSEKRQHFTGAIWKPGHEFDENMLRLGHSHIKKHIRF